MQEHDSMGRQKNDFKPKLIYAFTIHSNRHEGYIKVGETKIEHSKDIFAEPNSEGLNLSARRRIDQYTKTAGIEYSLLYTESACVWCDKENKVKTVRDGDIHKILISSGSERPEWGHEWFKCNIEDLKTAIVKAKSELSPEPKQKPKPNPEPDTTEVPETAESQKPEDNPVDKKPAEDSEYLLRMTKDLKSSYDELIRKDGMPDGYGEFSDIIDFYDFVKTIKPQCSKKISYSADCNILRLDGQPLSKETVCFLPVSIARRLYYMSKYVMTADELTKLGDKYYYSGQSISHTTYSDLGEWCAATTEPEKDDRNYNISNSWHSNSLQDVIDWRNERVCSTIRRMAEINSDILPPKAYSVLSKFTTDDLLKLTRIQHYTYNSSLHSMINKIKNSNRNKNKQFMYETLGVSIQATA